MGNDRPGLDDVTLTAVQPGQPLPAQGMLIGVPESLASESRDRCSTARINLASRPVQIPGYEILGELGRGGMGVVYKAWEIAAKRFVAIKMIVSDAVGDQQRLRRFRSEAEAIARLSHPNIIQVYRIGETEGFPFQVLEYCSGGSLAKKLNCHPLPPRIASFYAEKAALAMAEAHRNHIIDRDLKPGNILLTAEEELKITDFGIAKDLDKSDQNTRVGTLIGTPSYMPPEQTLGEGTKVGPPADVYALGAILYEMLTGRPPFRGVTALDTVELVRDYPVVPPRQLVPRIPQELEAICLRCLEKNPAKRYPTAKELAEDLTHYRHGQTSSIVLVSPKARHSLTTWCRCHPMAASLLLLLVISYLLFFLGTLAWLSR